MQAADVKQGENGHRAASAVSLVWMGDVIAKPIDCTLHVPIYPIPCMFVFLS